MDSNCTEIIPRAKTFVTLDLETSGLHPGTNGILQIGAWVTGEHEDHFKGYFLSDCNPFYPHSNGLPSPIVIDGGALKVNGFTSDRISNAPPLYEVLAAFNDFVNRWAVNTDVVFVYQNTPFDIAFMKAAFLKGGFSDKVFRRTLDTISFGFMVYGEVLSLSALCDRLGIVNGDAHDALADAFTTSKVFYRLQDELVTLAA